MGAQAATSARGIERNAIWRQASRRPQPARKLRITSRAIITSECISASCLTDLRSNRGLDRGLRSAIGVADLMRESEDQVIEQHGEKAAIQPVQNEDERHPDRATPARVFADARRAGANLQRGEAGEHEAGEPDDAWRVYPQRQREAHRERDAVRPDQIESAHSPSSSEAELSRHVSV